MARNVQGKTTETAREASGAENSKDSFNVLKISIVLAIIAGAVLLWYFGFLPGSTPLAPRQN